MKLIIDNREKKIIDIFNEKKNNDYELLSLDLGDFKITNGENILLIERKTTYDLWCSIKDGRYKEQKFRLDSFLKKNPINHRVLYLIEFSEKHKHQVPMSTIQSAILSIQFKSNIPCIQTNSCLDTYNFIQKIMKKLNDTIFCQNVISNNYVETICSIKKSENKNVKFCLISMLCQIPGISTKIAQELLKLDDIKSMEDFITFIKNLGKDEFCKIKINNRKIGKKGEAIFNNLINME